jgi:hypothetical protein
MFHELGKVEFKFTRKDVENAPSKMKDGRKIYNVTYEIKVDLFSDRGDLEFRAVLDGAPKGKGIIQYEQSFDMQHE